MTCPKCHRYPHACLCAEVEKATAELRAEVQTWRDEACRLGGLNAQHVGQLDEERAAGDMLRAALKGWVTKGAHASEMITAYGEVTKALVKLAKLKGATQAQIDRAMLGPK